MDAIRGWHKAYSAYGRWHFPDKVTRLIDEVRWEYFTAKGRRCFK
jgi:hypothetical protein